MIARDNERTIGPAIQSIRRHVGEMIVLDTGSKDRTPEIAASLGARVFHFPWCDDFSAARNESIRHARGQWIFCIDTDDTMDEENARKLPELVSGQLSVVSSQLSDIHRSVTLDTRHPALDTRHSSPPVLGFLMKVRCPTLTESGEAGFIEVDHVKLFRNLPELRFEHRIHEQILMAIRRAGGTVAWTDIFITHSNADQSPEGQARKLERDLWILGLERGERPDDPFTLFNLGMTYDKAGRYEEAIAFLWQSIGRSGSDDSHLRKAYALLVSSYRSLGRPRTALETCQQGLERFPRDVELRFRLGTLLHHFGRLNEAARVFEDLLQTQDDRHLSSVDRGLKGFRTRHHLAAVYADMGDLARAEEQWRLVLQEVPKYRLAWRGLGNVLLRQGKLDDAAAAAEHLLNGGSQRCEGAILKAHVLVARGDIAAARTELERASAESNGDLEPLRTLCRLLFEHGDPRDAKLAIEELVHRDPSDAAAYHNLGSIHLGLKSPQAAIEAYRQSLILRPDDPPTLLGLGLALKEAGCVNDALTTWRRVTELAPHGHAAEQASQRIRELSARDEQ